MVKRKLWKHSLPPIAFSLARMDFYEVGHGLGLNVLLLMADLEYGS